MRLLRRLFTVLALLSVVTGNMTVAAVMLDAAAPAFAAGAPEHVPPCADCGRDATAPAACVQVCLPAAEITSTPVLAEQQARPAARPVAALVGRVVAPDLHPPQAIS